MYVGFRKHKIISIIILKVNIIVCVGSRILILMDSALFYHVLVHLDLSFLEITESVVSDQLASDEAI